MKERTYIAILGGLLGFIFSLILEKIRKKDEANRQISYEKTIKADVIEFAHELKEQNENEEIEIKYNGRTVNNLAIISLLLKNTGNRDIRQQYLRLEFPKKCKFQKERYKIEPEMGFKEVKNYELKNHEKAYKIDYLRPNQEIELRFTIEADKNERIDIHPHWKDESNNHVSYISEESRQLRQVENERNTIQRFLTLCFLFLLIPSSYTNNYLLITTLFIKIIILGLIISLIPPITEIIIDFLTKKDTKKDSYVEINTAKCENSEVNVVINSPQSQIVRKPIVDKEQRYTTLENDLYELLEIIEDSNLTNIIKDDICIILKRLEKEIKRPTTRTNRIQSLCSDLQEIINELPIEDQPVQETNLLLTKIRESLFQ